jgi:RHS repeat-associated protein
MERDDETGLNYHSARYYAVWLGRWVSCDPSGCEYGLNLYLYGDLNSVSYLDKNGKIDIHFGRTESLHSYTPNESYLSIDEGLESIQGALRDPANTPHFHLDDLVLTREQIEENNVEVQIEEIMQVIDWDYDIVEMETYLDTNRAATAYELMEILFDEEIFNRTVWMREGVDLDEPSPEIRQLRERLTDNPDYQELYQEWVERTSQVASSQEARDIMILPGRPGREPFQEAPGAGSGRLDLPGGGRTDRMEAPGEGGGERQLDLPPSEATPPEILVTPPITPFPGASPVPTTPPRLVTPPPRLVIPPLGGSPILRPQPRMGGGAWPLMIPGIINDIRCYGFGICSPGYGQLPGGA